MHLVTGQDGVYVVGWEDGYNTALPEFLDNPSGMEEAYFEPRGPLWPMEDFLLTVILLQKFQDLLPGPRVHVQH